MKKIKLLVTLVFVLFFSVIAYSTISAGKARFYITNNNNFNIWIRCDGPTFHISPKVKIKAHAARVNFYTPRLDIGLRGRWLCTVCSFTKKRICVTKQFGYCETETTEIDIYVGKKNNSITITYDGALCT